MAAIRDLREWLAVLEEHGKVIRMSEPVNKETELIPLYRVQARGLPEAERKVLLFEEVFGAQGRRYDMRVACGVYAASEHVLALALGCENPADAAERWHQGVANPLEPVIVADGPVHEVVMTGQQLLDVGLDALPAPLEEVGWSQMIRTGLPVLSKHPETGVRNIGVYNGFFRARNRMAMGISPPRDLMTYHEPAARRRGEKLPIAILIGAPPQVMMTGVTPFPYGMDELAVAGGLMGQPLELVRCKTIPLEVPARTEIVIEGWLDPETLEPRLGFGEYPGYLNTERNMIPVMEVTAITHRRNAIWTPITVGFPPSDSNTLWSFGQGHTLYHNLRYQARLPVEEVYLSPAGGGNDFCVFRLREGVQDPLQVLQAATAFHPMGKYFVAVDHDVDLRDPDLLIWALCYGVRPEQDIFVIPGRGGGLDPSFGPAGSSRGQVASPANIVANRRNYYRVLIDATRRLPQPPVALPRREYMERALELWRERVGTPVNLRAPWYGYSLGHWTEDDEVIAQHMVRGEYRKVGEAMALQQKPASEVLGRS